MRGLFLTYLIANAIITWDEIYVNQRIPQPKRYVATTTVWVILGLIGEFGAAPLAAALGFGYIIAMLYNRFNEHQAQTAVAGAGESGTPAPPFKTR